VSGVAPGFPKCKKVENLLECNLQLGKLVKEYFMMYIIIIRPFSTRRICSREAKQKTNLANVIGEQQKVSVTKFRDQQKNLEVNKNSEINKNSKSTKREVLGRAGMGGFYPPPPPPPPPPPTQSHAGEMPLITTGAGAPV
jgi:hypothetical protein